MKEPRLDRMVETFIPITVSADATPIRQWQDYLDLLRTKVCPLVRALQERRLVDWYSFLVHRKGTGVPTKESDQGLYIHLRLELPEGVNQNALLSELPAFCEKTQIPEPPRPELDECDIRAFKDQKVEYGWRVLGEGSEWILRMLESHDPKVPIPPQNVSQFLHYIGNALLVNAVRIPMP